ncbi:MAG: DedA family protein [Cyanobacteria bacterium P01_A01_bin.15]
MDILERITDAIAQFGYVGIAFLMLLENVIPPIPSEVIMPLAGFAVARGEMSMAGAIAAGTVGTLAGALVWFYIGSLLGLRRICSLADRYGKWLGISSQDVLAVQRWFAKRGGYWSVALGRVLPSIRTYISVPAGIAKMPFLPFLICSLLGSFVWISFLTVAGYYLGDSYERIGAILAPIGKGITITLGVLFVSWLVYRWRKNSVKTSS